MYSNVNFCSCDCYRWRFCQAKVTKGFKQFSPLLTEVSGSLESFTVWCRSKCCYQIYAVLIGHIFGKWREVIKIWHSSVKAHSNYFLKNCAQNFMKPKRFVLYQKSLTFVFLCRQHCVFPLLDCAGFPFWWLEVVTHPLLLVSQHCIAYKMRAWSEELGKATLIQITVQSK